MKYAHLLNFICRRTCRLTFLNTQFDAEPMGFEPTSIYFLIYLFIKSSKTNLLHNQINSCRQQYQLANWLFLSNIWTIFCNNFHLNVTIYSKTLKFFKKMPIYMGRMCNLINYSVALCKI